MRYLLLCCLVSVALAQETGPITSFEAGQPQPFVASGARAEVVAEQASEGTHALRVEIPGSERDTWPGIAFRHDLPDWSGRVLLAMDVFLPGQDSQQLSFRLDDTEGHQIFGTSTLRPGWNRNFSVNVKALGAECNLALIKQLLLYIRMPRKDLTFYVDQVRWDTFEGFFKKTVHRTAPGESSVARPYELFTAPFERLVYPDTPATQPLEQLSLFAARGEHEPVTLALRAGQDLAAVQVEVGDLTGPAGAILPSDAWDITRFELLPKRFHYKSDSYLEDLPSYLAPQVGPLAIPAGVTRNFCLTLHAPTNAAPGVYRGEAAVVVDGARRPVPLQVRILPFELPELRGVYYGEYYRTFGKLVLTRADVERDLADMRNFGMTSVGLCFGVDSDTYTVEDGRVTFDFKGESRFEWFMDAYRDLGFPMPVILLSDSGQGAAAQAGAFDSDDYNHAYVAFHQALAAEAARRGWPRIVVQPVDEPSWQTEEHKTRNLRLLQLLHEAGIPTEQDGPPDAYFHNVAGPYADVWNYNGALGTADQVAAAKAAGKQITIYNNDVESYRPEVDRWAYGLFNWRHDMQGGFNWEYRGGYGDLYNNLDHDTGDWVHRYPPTEAHPGGPSTGFVGSREGIDDRKYLALLEQEIAAAPADSTAARTAQAILDDLRRRLNDAPTVRSRAAWAATLSAADARQRGYDVPDDVASVVVGDLKQPNGLTFDEYGTIRWLVARQIALLRAARGVDPAWIDPVAAPTTGAPSLENIARRAAGGIDAAARPTTRLPMLAAAPTIDGNLDTDPGWAGAVSLSLALASGAGPAEMPTTAKVGLHDQTLYVGFICGEDRLDSLTARVTDPAGRVWEDDCVEIFIDPQVTEKRFYQVVVNTLGTILAKASDDSAWQPAVQAKAQLDPARNRWLAEIAIPVGDLALAPRFGFNLGRERRPTEVTELSTWSVTGGGFGQPARFGLAVVEGDLPAAKPVEPKLQVSVSPGYLAASQTGTTLHLRLQLDQARLPQAEATLRVGDTMVPIPGPLAEQYTAVLPADSLPFGDTDLTVTVTAPDTPALSATARVTRVPSAF